MADMNARNAAGSQYESADNLNARTALHARFSTNCGWTPWVFDRLKLPDECSVLEVGCGTGALWLHNGRKIPDGWRLVLSDLSSGMVETARRNLSRLPQVEDIVLIDAQSIPYASESFDAVIANHMLYHVSDTDRALSEIRRVLKGGGSLYATTIGMDNMKEFWELLTPLIRSSDRIDPNEIMERFSLETGARRLAGWFEHVEEHRFSDSLRVTEVEALVAYAQSLSTNNSPLLAGDQLERFRTAVAECIREDGAFHITKSSGILIARKSGERLAASQA